ncbi:hypothetical protein PEC106568_40810 [Pectobacterium carotovorum subsp. carotovorum]|nr:hypothetical protein PEC106568_40810 [Pectobacterium carotovorum subsp. carotovorum]
MPFNFVKNEILNALTKITNNKKLINFNLVKIFTLYFLLLTEQISPLP